MVLVISYMSMYNILNIQRSVYVDRSTPGKTRCRNPLYSGPVAPPKDSVGRPMSRLECVLSGPRPEKGG